MIKKVIRPLKSLVEEEIKKGIAIKFYINSVTTRSDKTKELFFYYQKEKMTLKEFLTETAKMTVERFNNGEAVEAILKCINCDLVDGKADEQVVIDTMIENFSNGKLKILQKEEEHQDLDKEVILKNGTEFTLNRMLYVKKDKDNKI